VEIRTVRFWDVEGEGLNFCKLRGRSYGKNQAKVWRVEEQERQHQLLGFSLGSGDTRLVS
jgi:hypothetical protein